MLALEMRHRRHAVGMHLAALVDRDILADHEAFVREMKANVVGQIDVVVIVEPTRHRLLDGQDCQAGLLH